MEAKHFTYSEYHAIRTKTIKIYICKIPTKEISPPSSENKGEKPKEIWEKFVKAKKKFHVQEIKQPKKMSKRRFIPTERVVKSSKSFKPLNREIRTPRKEHKKHEKVELLDSEGEDLIRNSRHSFKKKYGQIIS